jgi:hypothetical protein
MSGPSAHTTKISAQAFHAANFFAVGLFGFCANSPRLWFKRNEDLALVRYIYVFLFSMFISLAAWSQTKPPKVPSGLEKIDGRCNPGDNLDTCGSVFFAIEVATDGLQSENYKGYDSSWHGRRFKAYEGARYSYRLKRRKKVNGQQIPEGSILRGVAVYERQKRDKINMRWIVEPEWSDIVMWRSDFALVKKPGSDNWFRLELVSKQSQEIGHGEIKIANELSKQHIDMKNWGGVPIFKSHDAAGNATVRTISRSGEFGPVIDYIAPASLLPSGSAGVEVLEDRHLLVHRVDAQGKPFDQVFTPGGQMSLTPPLAPLMKVEYREGIYSPVYEIDRSLGLFWPVTTGQSILEKPSGLLGLRPLLSDTGFPLEAVEFERADTKPFGHCRDTTVNCPFSQFWIAVWETDEGQRLAPVGSLSLYDKFHPTLEQVLESQTSAFYDRVSMLEVPKGLKKRASESLFDHEQVKIMAARRADGSIDVIGNPAAFRYPEKLERLNSEPLIDMSDAKAFVQELERQFVEQRQETKQWWENRERERVERIAQARAEAEAQRRRQNEQRQQLLEQALAESDFGPALDLASWLGPRAITRATDAALAAGRCDLVSDSELSTARLYGERGLQINVDSCRASRRAAFAEKYVSSSMYGETETNRTISGVPAPISRPKDYAWESKLNYLKGHTSQYQCGSASFCN